MIFYLETFYTCEYLLAAQRELCPPPEPLTRGQVSKGFELLLMSLFVHNQSSP